MTTVLSSKVYAIDALLVAGTFTLANVNSVLPFGESSRILSIRRVVVAGAPGTPVAYKVAPTGAGAGAVWGLTVDSSSATDISTYQVSWVNDYIPSQYLTQGGLLVNAQFSP